MSQYKIHYFSFLLFSTMAAFVIHAISEDTEPVDGLYYDIYKKIDKLGKRARGELGLLTSPDFSESEKEKMQKEMVQLVGKYLDETGRVPGGDPNITNPFVSPLWASIAFGNLEAFLILKDPKNSNQTFEKDYRYCNRPYDSLTCAMLWRRSTSGHDAIRIILYDDGANPNNTQFEDEKEKRRALGLELANSKMLARAVRSLHFPLPKVCVDHIVGFIP